jgi:hypothetical protein
MDHLLGVGFGEVLDVGALGLWKLVAKQENLGRSVGLLLYGLRSGLILLPDGDDHEGKKHGVDDAQGRVDEASDFIVALARRGGHEPMDQLKARERDEANPTDDQGSVNYRVQHSDYPPS